MMNKEWIIPDVILVGYGRTQLVQFKCLNCGRLYFPNQDTYNYLCDECDKLNITIDEWRLHSTWGTLNVIGWEQRTSMSEADHRKSKHYKEVLERDDYTCQYCGAKTDLNKLIKLTIDHVIPFVYGGNDLVDNLVAACSECNQMASDKTFNNFMEKKYFIINMRKHKKLEIRNRELCPFKELLNDYHIWGRAKRKHRVIVAEDGVIEASQRFSLTSHCLNCGNPIMEEKKAYHSLYCSDKCKAIGKTDTKEETKIFEYCQNANCGKPLSEEKQRRHAKYCNKFCGTDEYREQKTVIKDKICANRDCNKIIPKRRYDYNPLMKVKYCCNQCGIDERKYLKQDKKDERHTNREKLYLADREARPWIFKRLCAAALTHLMHNWSGSFSIRGFFYVLRKEGHKINDHLSSFYARDLIKWDKRLAEIIEIR